MLIKLCTRCSRKYALKADVQHNARTNELNNLAFFDYTKETAFSGCAEI